MPLQSETKEQIDALEWANWYPPLRRFFFAIPNGGFRNKKEAAILKSMGVRSGVSDLFLAIPNNDYYGLWIEVKTLNKHGRVNPLSTNQSNFLNDMIAAGYDGQMCIGSSEIILAVTHHLRNGAKIDIPNIQDA